MKMILENKAILISVTAFILVVFLYNSFFKPEPVPVSDELTTSSVGNDLLKIHDDLQKITFDQSIFSSTVYLGLIDFNIAIPEQATGRVNPFDVIGRD